MRFQLHPRDGLLMLEKIQCKRRRGPQRIRWLDDITDSMDMWLWVCSDAGRDWGQEKGMTEDEIAGWHH